MPFNVFGGIGAQGVDHATPATRTEFARIAPDANLQPRIPRQRSVYLNQADPDFLHKGLESAVVSYMPIPVYDGINLFLEHIFGTKVTTGAGPFTHTFSLANSLPANGVSIEQAKQYPSASNAALATGCKNTRATFEFAAGEEVKIGSQWFARQRTQVTASAAPTFPDYDNDRIFASEAVIQLDGSAENIKTITFDVGQSMDESRGFLGSAYAAEALRAAAREIRVSIAKEWDDQTVYDKFISGASATLLLTCTGAGNNAFELRCDNVVYAGDHDDETTEAEKAGQSIPAMVLRDATIGALRGVMTNDSAA